MIADQHGAASAADATRTAARRDGRDAGLRRWSRCVARPAQEFPRTALPVLSGSLPTGLNGTLYRNGPARLERGGLRVGHWFDGDGAVLAVRFAAGSAEATYRYVQSRGFRHEQQAGRLLYGSYGMTAPGPIWSHLRRPLKNSANTSVMALPDRLLALWEAGRPYALDAGSLATLGVDDLAGPGGRLGWLDAFSAHPKRDPESGDHYNFGVGIGGRDATLHLYRCDHRGRIAAQGRHRLDGIPLIHDYVMAGRWLVFLVAPIRLGPLPVLLGRSSYSDALHWRPELGTEVLVFDRRTLRLAARGETEPWFQWHFGNGAEAEDGSGTLRLDFVRYEDFGTNRHLSEVARGRTETPAHGRLWRMRLRPSMARVDEIACMSERSVEFPVVAPGRVGQPWTGTFMAVHRRDSDSTAERYDGLARFDHRTGRLAEADFGGGRYPSEPALAPDAASESEPARHWLITVVYDGNTDAGEVWVFDAGDLEAGPVCVLGLPDVVPLGFHGCWHPST
jgi:carotenoid cleavage dioxygenase-like enzyme